MAAQLTLATGALAQTVCHPADETSAALIVRLGRYSSATSGDDRIVRDSLRLAPTAANQVVLVTSESVCKNARDAHQAFFPNRGGAGFTGRVYVIKIGMTYAALDPGYNYGDPTVWTVEIIDSRYRHLSVY